jgi:hypothetical protein
MVERLSSLGLAVFIASASGHVLSLRPSRSDVRRPRRVCDDQRRCRRHGAPGPEQLEQLVECADAALCEANAPVEIRHTTATPAYPSTIPASERAGSHRLFATAFRHHVDHN